jgi:hypothetical protein
MRGTLLEIDALANQRSIRRTWKQLFLASLHLNNTLVGELR